MIRALALFLAALGASCPACADTAKPVTSIVLEARDELPDPNFKDSVVLVMNNIAPAPAGLILNRPTRLAVARLFPEVERLAQLDDRIYFGGPVGIDSVSFLFRTDSPPEHATEVLDGIYLSMDRDLLRKLLDRDKPMEGLRIFIGYSGWGPGQLQAEIRRGDWKIAPAEAGAIFGKKSEHPWPEQTTPEAGPRI